VIKKIILFIVGGALVFAVLGTVSFAYITKDLPNPELLENRQVAESTKIFDRTGEVLLYEIHGEERRTIIPFEDIPEHIKQATLAMEDKTFYKHRGFNIFAILKGAVIEPITGKRERARGGSTITQQLAKNAFLTPERTLTRKLRELTLAIYLEQKFTKNEIFNLYLNQIPYGSNAYGIEAASQTFFEKSAKELNLAEAALLTALPKAPTYYSPYGSHTKELMTRKDLALEKMYELDFITEEEKELAQKTQLTFAAQSTGIKAPHFVIAIQEYLNNKYGEDFVRTAGFRVITTLDWKLQQIAERVVFEGTERNKNLYQGHNAALVAQDATSGQVLVLVGSKDYFGSPEPENCSPGVDCRFEGNFNVAIQGFRQPGSALKPFAYAVAFQKGYSPETIVFDLPTEFAANNPNCSLIVNFNLPAGEEKNKECFHPRNFDEFFRGPVSLRNALAQSINVPSVKTLYLAGIDNVLRIVKDFGITTLTERSRYGLSLVLGGGEVKLYELVGAYSVFPQEGKRHKQTMILEIKDKKGKILEKYQDKVKEVMDPQIARLINDILSDVEARSALFSNSLNLTVFPNHQVALKTGTTNDYRDAWAIGYTPSLVVGVWAGNNNNEPMQQRAGSILAAIPMWHNFMAEALKNRPTITFNKPEPVIQKGPMLRGEYVVNYRVDNEIYPQIHNLLFYVNKNFSQFENWEIPVLEWAAKNIPNFLAIYNKPVPQNAALSQSQQLSQLVINLLFPQNGNYIKNNQLTIAADIKSVKEISKIEVYFNEKLIDAKNENLGTDYNYRFQTANIQANLQNILKIVVFDKSNIKKEKEIILYK